MRILMPLETAYGGGIARTSVGLAESLPGALGPDDRLDLLSTPGAADVPPSVGFITPRGRRFRRGPLRAVGTNLQLAVHGRGFDLIHMTDYQGPLLARVPFSLTVHDVTFLDHPQWFPPATARYKRITLAISARKRPALVVCYSDFSRRRLLHHHPELAERSLVRVIHPGLAPPRTVPERAVDFTSEYFLTVSYIEPRKNHLGLLNAFRRARREGLSLRWKVVGGAMYDADRIFAELRATDGVDVIGRVSEDELERLYAGAAFVATPSFEEGFGYPPLEAMARGVPVVCSTGSSLDETAGDAALRAAPADETAWAEALRRMADDAELRRDLVTRGFAQVKRFTWAATAEAHVAAFREATARLHSRGR